MDLHGIPLGGHELVHAPCEVLWEPHGKIKKRYKIKREEWRRGDLWEALVVVPHPTHRQPTFGLPKSPLDIIAHTFSTPVCHLVSDPPVTSHVVSV